MQDRSIFIFTYSLLSQNFILNKHQKKENVKLIEEIIRRKSAQLYIVQINHNNKNQEQFIKKNAKYLIEYKCY